jgi:catechol 2,3-dioxygenase-like lactoylglutathione lyase family enzyme
LDDNTHARVCSIYEKFRIMVNTYGLTHVAVAVRDLDRTQAFYTAILGAVVVYRDAGFLQMQTPGARDVLVFEKDARKAGKAGGVLHFGFRLTKAKDIEAARQAVKKAGGTIRDTGEFVPGEPYLFAEDPDGYTIEIWYEIPTPIDPA